MYIVEDFQFKKDRFAPIVVYQCIFDIQCFHDYFLNPPTFIDIEYIKNSKSSRKAEFLAGRICIDKALKALKYPTKNALIKNDSYGCPIWPNNIIGSVTHSNSMAFSACAYNYHVDYIGIDCEPIISDDTSELIKDTVLNIQEWEIINKHFSTKGHAITLVYSAKESIYKALYPNVKKILEFNVVELTAFDYIKNTMIFNVMENLSDKWKMGCEISISFEFINGHFLHELDAERVLEFRRYDSICSKKVNRIYFLILNLLGRLNLEPRDISHHLGCN